MQIQAVKPRLNAMTAITAAAWFRTLSDVYSAIPIVCDITTFSKPFFGVRLLVAEDIQSNFLSVVKNRIRAGDKFVDQQFYFFGHSPWAGQANDKFLLRTNTRDKGDWFVSHRTSPAINVVNEHNPFGPHWLLCRWHHEELGSKMDDNTHSRARLQFEYLPLSLSLIEQVEAKKATKTTTPVEASTV